MINLREAEKRSHIQRRLLLYHIQQGHLPAKLEETLAGKAYAINEQDLEQFLQRPRRPGRPAKKGA